MGGGEGRPEKLQSEKIAEDFLPPVQDHDVADARVRLRLAGGLAGTLHGPKPIERRVAIRQGSRAQVAKDALGKASPSLTDLGRRMTELVAEDRVKQDMVLELTRKGDD